MGAGQGRRSGGHRQLEGGCSQKPGAVPSAGPVDLKEQPGHCWEPSASIQEVESHRALQARSLAARTAPSWVPGLLHTSSQGLGSGTLAIYPQLTSTRLVKTPRGDKRGLVFKVLLTVRLMRTARRQLSFRFSVAMGFQVPVFL